MRSAATMLLLAVLTGLTGGATYAQSAPLVITDVTVIDGTAGAARPHMTVVIRGGRIAAVDPAARTPIPPGGTILDGRGKFLIPGLWDMHVHLAKAGDKALGLFLANGVTSVRDMGGDFALVARWRSEIEAGTRVGPRIRTAGPLLESAARVRRMKARGTVEPVDRFRAPVADTVDAVRVVDSVTALGVDFVKVRTAPSREVYLAIASETRRVGLTLAAHGDIVSPEVMLDAGQRSIEHAIYPPLQKRDAAVRTRLVRRLADAHVAVVPTMVDYYQWRLVSPAAARRIVDDTLGRLDPRRRYISGYLLDDWREQVAERRLGRLPEVAWLVLSDLASVSEWSVLWLLVAAVALRGWKRPWSTLERWFTAIVVAYVGLLSGSYLFSTWIPWQPHVTLSVARLIFHVTPVALWLTALRWCAHEVPDSAVGGAGIATSGGG